MAIKKSSPWRVSYQGAMLIGRPKSFWLIMILLNVAIVSGSGYVIYTRLNTHLAPPVKEIHPTPVPIPQEAKEEKAAPLSDAARQFLAENTPAKAPEEKKEEPLKPMAGVVSGSNAWNKEPFGSSDVVNDVNDHQTTKPSVIKSAEKESIKIKKAPKKVKAIKTVFKYKNSKAKSVSVSGSFTKWKDIKMEKKKGVWQANIWILPGTYLFHYIVDGQKVLDSSKPTASIGESIIDAGN